LDEEIDKTRKERGYSGSKLELAARILRDIIRNDEFTEFLTLPAYEYLD
jgi:malate synthase